MRKSLFSFGNPREEPTREGTLREESGKAPASEVEHSHPPIPSWHSNFYNSDLNDPARSFGSMDGPRHSGIGAGPVQVNNLESLVHTRLPALERKYQNFHTELVGIQNKILPALLLKIEKLQMQVSKHQQQLGFLTGTEDAQKNTHLPFRHAGFGEKGSDHPHIPWKAFNPKTLWNNIRHRTGQSDIGTDIWAQLLMMALSIFYPILVYMIKGATVIIVLITGIFGNLSLFIPILEVKPNTEKEGDQLSDARPGIDSLSSSRITREPNLRNFQGFSRSFDEISEGQTTHEVAADASPSVQDDDSPQRSSFASTASCSRRENSLLYRLRQRK